RGQHRGTISALGAGQSFRGIRRGGLSRERMAERDWLHLRARDHGGYGKRVGGPECWMFSGSAGRRLAHSIDGLVKTPDRFLVLEIGDIGRGRRRKRVTQPSAYSIMGRLRVRRRRKKLEKEIGGAASRARGFLSQSNGERPCRRHRHTAALDPGRKSGSGSRTQLSRT